MADDLELILDDAAAWREWLTKYHASQPAAWLVLAKKGTVEPTSLNYDQALEEALCHGWIDGQARRRDEATYRQRFTPRRKKSPWSQRNVGIATRLTSEGRMHPAGLAEVERAKADGRWDAAYAGQASIEMPPDLAEALTSEPRAQAMFDILTSQNRYAVISRIEGAKRPKPEPDESSNSSRCWRVATRSTPRSASSRTDRPPAPYEVMSGSCPSSGDNSAATRSRTIDSRTTDCMVRRDVVQYVSKPVRYMTARPAMNPSAPSGVAKARPSSMLRTSRQTT